MTTMKILLYKASFFSFPTDAICKFKRKNFGIGSKLDRDCANIPYLMFYRTFRSNRDYIIFCRTTKKVTKNVKYIGSDFEF